MSRLVYFLMVGLAFAVLQVSTVEGQGADPNMPPPMVEGEGADPICRLRRETRKVTVHSKIPNPRALSGGSASLRTAPP